jgi:DNA damage-inducible protein 1
LPAAAKAIDDAEAEEGNRADDGAGAAPGPVTEPVSEATGNVSGGVPGASVTQTQSPAPAPGASTESKIAKLVELGFDRAKCAEALEASGGNEEYAASLLFSGF